MNIERQYAFRDYLNTVHRPDRRDTSIRPGKNEIFVEDGWTILLEKNASPLLLKTAKDLQDYFFTSMNVSVLLKKGERISVREKTIVLRIQKKGKEDLHYLSVPKSYVLECRNNGISICGADDRGTAQGCYYLEDLMNLKEAPILPFGTIHREPAFSPRMVHSGWGLDFFPDTHLNAIAHAGMDAILLFAKDVDSSAAGYLDFNDLIIRAASFGIDVYFYSEIKSLKHPDAPDAMEYYENTYGKLFRKCPGAKGVILVGESCEFPSRDPHTTGKLFAAREEGIRPKKARPGWWPCCDFPEWLDLVKSAVRRESPSADIVFWTYNWGYTPEADRIRLIDSLPEDITLLVTYEMFEKTENNGIRNICMDYSIYQPGPGRVFVSEAKAAKKKNIRLYAMSNTAGMTWDFGTVPYVPVPQQWEKRHDSLLESRKKWNLCGLMEGHHYGFYPSIVSELAKWNFWLPVSAKGDILKKLAVRDFGENGAKQAMKAWRLWSECCPGLPPTNEDQYGPARVGPSYPLIFIPDISRDFKPQEIQMPASEFAYTGSRIVKTFYHPFENEQQSSGVMRFPVEIRTLTKVLKCWEQGVSFMEKAIALAPERKKADAEKMLGLGRYIANSIVTIIHMKQWWLLNQELLLERNSEKALHLLDKIEELAQEEIANAERTIPLVEADSRLGWEPTMDYMTDREHLEWKIRQVRSTLEYEIPVYRKIVSRSGKKIKFREKVFSK